jgi:hypothetical protein
LGLFLPLRGVVCDLNTHGTPYPPQWVDDIAKAGADQFTFHIEATGEGNNESLLIQLVIFIAHKVLCCGTENPKALIEQIKAANMKVRRDGIAVSSESPWLTLVFCF